MRVLRLVCLLVLAALPVAADEPLMDWSPWQRYRETVSHPCAYFKAGDLARALENIRRYEWARNYAKGVEEGVRPLLGRFTPEFVEQMVPATTPLRAFPCPACRDQNQPKRTAGGAWRWSVDDPEHLKCDLCGTLFPNEKYAETVVVQAKWGGGQTLTFYGGETMKSGSYKFYRPSFTGMIRARKVAWARGTAQRLALAYALTGKTEYAAITRKLLIRFAQVYPHWLFHSDYGEFADMDPHVAGLHAGDLPADELVYPPNKPDRALFVGYWQSGRADVGGGEASVTNSLLQAYDLTCTATNADGTPLYAPEERVKIERDLLLESCIHLFGDKSINNKSVSGRIAVAMVGIALGHPGFVRFGLEGFEKSLNGYFLADGCAPDSPAYAMMVLRGIYQLGQSIRGYSDPPGYTGADGKRIENLNLYETGYKLVWQRLFEGLQGDLRFPPYADSYRWTELGAHFAELLAANYPGNPQYLALLKEYAGADLSKGDAETALFFRDPGLEARPSAPLTLHDTLFPAFRLGQMRAGEHGRESLVLLSATDWVVGHHHLDSLNLYYWKNGQELLSDLGYLWDHPMHDKTSRTFAHNTGMVDLQDQIRKGRGGQFHLFHTGNRVRVMEASSQASAAADVYRRTIAWVDHAADGSYLVDLFRMRADGSRDLVYHGPNRDYETQGIPLQPTAPVTGMDLTNTRSADSSGNWTAAWKIGDNLSFTVRHCGQPGETVTVGDGWGQRDSRNADLGAILPYIVRRHPPQAGVSTFCTLYEAYSPAQGALLKSVVRLPLPHGHGDNAAALRIETKGGTDYVISQAEPADIELDTPLGKLRTNARLAVLFVRDGKRVSAALAGGTMLRLDGTDVDAAQMRADPGLLEQAKGKRPLSTPPARRP